MKFLLYGAYGYTGELIVEMAGNFGLEPILAGRNEEKLRALSQKSGYAFRSFNLDNIEQIQAQLKDIDLVIHAAGPFKYTARPMMEACIQSKTHYLDITGEIEVFELGAKLGSAAAEAGITLMPGVGFDVVPTDCMAAYLKKKLPDAIDLKLAFASVGGGVSHGTASTMAERLGELSARRENGKIVGVPLGVSTMNVPFPGKDRFAMSIPWGDVSTAYHSTGIPNIEVFTSVHPKSHARLKYQKYIDWLLRTDFVRNQVKKRIKKGPAGPSPEKRVKANSLIWGQVTNAAGVQKAAQMTTLEGYTLTATTSLMIAKKVLEGNFKKGFQTPSNGYGADLIMEVPSTVRTDL